MAQMVVQTELTPEDFYDILDAGMTDILASAGIEVIDAKTMEHLVYFNRNLRIALGLPSGLA